MAKTCPPAGNFFAAAARSVIVLKSEVHKGTRRRLTVPRSVELRALCLIAACVVIPAGGSVYLIVSSTQTDLSDLSPKTQPAGDLRVLKWSSLLRDPAHALDGSGTTFTGIEVRALGYMMDGDRPLRKGERVHNFVLLPDPGNLLHPAHRFGDQMIAVHLRDGEATPFRPAQLVWVRGRLRVGAGDPGGSSPLYALEQAYVQPAPKTEIARYFR